MTQYIEPTRLCLHLIILTHLFGILSPSNDMYPGCSIVEFNRVPRNTHTFRDYSRVAEGGGALCPLKIACLPELGLNDVSQQLHSTVT